MGTPLASSPPRLNRYLEQVSQRIDVWIASPELHGSQKELLGQVLELQRARVAANPLGNPVALPYLIASAWGRELDEQSAQVGAFCTLYMLSLDLFDDVQDQDLEGKPHERVGAPIAINDALTLFFLALKALHRAIELETDPERRLDYARVLDRATLLAAGAQHCDLAGLYTGATRKDVLAMQQAKISSAGLFTEMGALLAGCGPEDRVRYREIGEHLATLVQIGDDLRDIYGKKFSPDLANGTSTYPLACLRDCGSTAVQSRFDELRRSLPASLPAIRELLYDAGVVQQSAEAMEQFREEIHRLIAETGNQSGYHRLFLQVIDSLVSSIFEPPTLEVSAPLYVPRGSWHDRVRAELETFLERMAPYAPPPAPELRPWHLPQWMYHADQNRIYYPDLDDLGEEILPFQQELLGTTDLAQLDRLVRRQLPIVLCHEMFHYWRDASGRLSNDHWHEEWAANRLAVAYARQYCQDVLDYGLSLASEVLQRFPNCLDDEARTLLDSCQEDRSGQRQGYGMGLLPMAVVTLEMVRRLAAERPSLSDAVAQLLGAACNATHAAA